MYSEYIYIINHHTLGSSPLFIQVQSNDLDAIYSLLQKERELPLRFPFQITVDGEIQLTEQLDREVKDRVHYTCSVHSLNLS